MGRYEVVLTDGNIEYEFDGGSPVIYYFVTGAGSPRQSYFIHKIQGKRFKDFKRKVSLRFSAGGDTREVTHLYLLERGKAVSDFLEEWIIVDPRYFLQDILFDSTFNEIRSSNTKKRPTNIVGVATLNQYFQIPANVWKKSTLKDANTRHFADIKDDSAQPWTSYDVLRWALAHDGGWLDTTPPGVKDRYEALFGEIVVDDSQVPTNRRWPLAPKEWNPRNGWGVAVNALLRRCRLGMYFYNGKYVLTDLAVDQSKFKGLGEDESYGIPIPTYMANKAPVYVSRKYPALQEIRFDYDEERMFYPVIQHPYEVPVDYGRFDLINVMEMPHDMKVETKVDDARSAFLTARWSGLKVNLNYQDTLREPNRVHSVVRDAVDLDRGTWQSIARALDAFNRDVKNYPSGQVTNPYMYENILRYIMSRALGHFLQVDENRYNYTNPITAARVSSLYTYFRQYFKIPDDILEMIDTWQVKRVDVFDTATRTRSPTTVYADYTEWLSVISPRVKIQGVHFNPWLDPLFPNLSKPSSYVEKLTDNVRPHFNHRGTNLASASNPGWERPDPETGRTNTPHSPYSHPLEGLVPAPLQARVVDPSNGVFALSFPTDLNGEVEYYMMGTPIGKTIPKDTFIATSDQITIEQMRLAPCFRMSIILAIKWKTPNDSRRFYEIFTDTVAAGLLPEANGPVMESFEAGYEAAFAWEEYAPAVVFQDTVSGQPIVSRPALPINDDILQEWNDAQNEIDMFDFEDRIIGAFKAAGWRNIMPGGNVAMTSWQSEAAGEPSTNIQANYPPRKPLLWELLGPVAMNVLGRFDEMTHHKFSWE